MRILLSILLLTNFCFAGDNGKIIVGSQKKIFSQDASTSAMNFVDYPHHELHEGNHYTWGTSDGDLDIVDTLTFILTTADTAKWAHLIFNVYGALHTKVELYENTTHTTSTLQTAYNNNRNSSNTALMTINLSNNDAADGTLIFATEWGVDTGGGANRRSGGGESRGDTEWVLKQNTKYLIMVISLTNNNVVNLCLSWYEHADRN